MKIKAGEGTRKYNLFLRDKFKLHRGVWYVWHNNEYQPYWTTPKTHRKHIYHLKQIKARRTASFYDKTQGSCI